MNNYLFGYFQYLLKPNKPNKAKQYLLKPNLVRFLQRSHVNDSMQEFICKFKNIIYILSINALAMPT